MPDETLDARIDAYLERRGRADTPENRERARKYVLELDRFEREMPQRWQDVPWEAFPMRVQHAGREWTVADMQALRSRQIDGETPPEFKALVDRFNWDYLRHPSTYEGQVLSVGLYFGYPKCCIYSFGLRNQTFAQLSDDDKALLRALDDELRWVPCADCLETLREAGIEVYLKEMATHPAHSERHAPD